MQAEFLKQEQDIYILIDNLIRDIINYIPNLYNTTL